MDIQTRDSAAIGNTSNSSNSATAAPANQDVDSFSKAMGSEGAACENCPGCPSCSGGKKDTGNSPLNDPSMQDMLGKVLELVQMLLEKVQGGELNTRGGNNSAGGGGADQAEGTGSGSNAPASQKA